MARHPIGRRWGGGWTGFGIGLAASVLIDVAGPQIARAAGPAAKSVLKFCFGVSDQIARAAARGREQVEDFIATTRAEYDAEQEGRAMEPAAETGADGAKPEA
jgi:hypothetical protein